MITTAVRTFNIGFSDTACFTGMARNAAFDTNRFQVAITYDMSIKKTLSALRWAFGLVYVFIPRNFNMVYEFNLLYHTESY